MTANTPSHASTAKPLTGTAVMLLIEVGKFDLDTPVKEYFKRWIGSTERTDSRSFLPEEGALGSGDL